MVRIRTDTAVRAIKSAGDGQIEHSVDGVRGLTLRVTTGGKKSWSLRYRNHDGEQRRVTLGAYPELGLATARERAKIILGAVAGGADPAREARVSKAAARSRKVTTVADLIGAYMSDASRGRHRPNARPKRLSSVNLDQYYADRLVIPRLGKLGVSELNRDQVQRFLDEVGENSPANARHCRNVLRQAYNYAIRREITEKNPAQLSDLPLPGSRERVLDQTELRRIWLAAETPMETQGLSLALGTGLAIQLAMLTLQRGGEVVGIHAREIDRRARIWTIPGDRTKNHRTHVVPLSDAALDVLQRAFDLTAEGSAIDWRGYAFPSPRDTDRSITRRAFSRATQRLLIAIEIGDAVAHDFRRTGATMITGEQIGIPRFIVSRVLNQASDTGGAAAVTSVYDRNEYLVEKRRTLEAWARLLQEIIRDQQGPSNVVRLAG